MLSRSSSVISNMAAASGRRYAQRFNCQNVAALEPVWVADCGEVIESAPDLATRPGQVSMPGPRCRVGQGVLGVAGPGTIMKSYPGRRIFA